MPTYEALDRFWQDYRRLTPEQRRAFQLAVEKFIADLKARRFRKGLRIKAVQGTDGIYEMTWADDGRATFPFGTPIHAGEPHVIWRRCGTHDIFEMP